MRKIGKKFLLGLLVAAFVGIFTLSADANPLSPNEMVNLMDRLTGFRTMQEFDAALGRHTRIRTEEFPGEEHVAWFLNNNNAEIRAVIGRGFRVVEIEQHFTTPAQLNSMREQYIQTITSRLGRQPRRGLQGSMSWTNESTREPNWNYVIHFNEDETPRATFRAARVGAD